jgi:hypothetical protein
MDEISVKLNAIAQGLVPLESGAAWFGGLSADAQKSVLQKLGVFVLQAHPAKDEALLALRRSGVKGAATPAVLLVRDDIRESIGKILRKVAVLNMYSVPRMG